jgi:hypothetical protein
MRIMRLLEKLKHILVSAPASRHGGKHHPQRRDPEFAGQSNKEVEDLPPERAAELAGHAPERVDT